MIKKFKRWLIERILPVWARAALIAEIDVLKRENEELRHEIERQSSYIRGLESGIRSQRRIVINTGEVKK